MWKGRQRWVFLLPAFLWVIAFVVFPLGYSLYIAFHNVDQRVEVVRERVAVVDDQGNPVLDEDGEAETKLEIRRENVTEWEFVGFTNFERVFTNRESLNGMRVSAIFLVSSVTVEMILGMALAVLFNHQIAARGFLRAIMILPIFATPIAVAYLFFTIFYEEGGPLAWTTIPWLSSGDWALVAIILVDIWQWTPFCFLIFLAGLQGVSQELVESARLETKSQWSIFWNIMFPLLEPVIIIVLLLRLADALKLFAIPFALTGGGPGIATQSYPLYAFRAGLRYFDVGFASAMSYVLLIFVMIVVTLMFRRLRRIYG
ncbi:MAG: sugar ABC transporter permease [Azospirillaceae bacterium]